MVVARIVVAGTIDVVEVPEDLVSFNAYMEIGTTMAVIARIKTMTNTVIKHFFLEIIHAKFIRSKCRGGGLGSLCPLSFKLNSTYLRMVFQFLLKTIPPIFESIACSVIKSKSTTSSCF